MLNFTKSIPAARTLPPIPHLEDVSETYAGLLKRHLDLSGRLGSINQAIQANEALIRDRRRPSVENVGRGPEVPNDRVASLLGEEAPKDITLPLEQETAQLRQQARDLQDAINVLAQRLTTARMEASAIICQKIEPDLRAILSELASKMAEVSHLALHYRRFAQQLNAAQIAWSDLDPMGIRAGGVADRGSQFALWLNAAAQRGYISVDVLPQEIRS